MYGREHGLVGPAREQISWADHDDLNKLDQAFFHIIDPQVKRAPAWILSNRVMLEVPVNVWLVDKFLSTLWTDPPTKGHHK